ncbi:hypothetical protein [Desulfovibrio piger]|uniref:hypothetical protein n=1 Tax=Desulfovibrio piger TaxID=901 RepID=UPI0024330269|nr:hypothetical protein [Desulfovibrio piger]
MRQITISCKDNQLFFLAIQRNFPFWKKKKLFLRTRKKGGGTEPPPKDFLPGTLPPVRQHQADRTWLTPPHDRAALPMAEKSPAELPELRKD